VTHADFTDRRIPTLLDRLVSYHDGSHGRLRKSPPGPPVTTHEVCQLVLADLRQLLTARALAPSCPALEDPRIARSVINYGVADSSGRNLDMPLIERVRTSVRRAVEAFEPRIVPGTLRVDVYAENAGDQGAGAEAARATGSTPNAIVIEISAQACALPMPEQIVMRTMFHADGVVAAEGEARG
jgi:type VI secretion system protein ImpF